MTPSLQHMLPMLERLLTYWEKSASKPHYKLFVPALNTGMAKLNDYDEQSAESDACTLWQ